MEKYGRVVEIKGDIAFVELETKNSETKCNYSSFCGRSRRADTTIEAIFDNKIQKGERVKVDIYQLPALKKILFLYLIPLIGFFLAVVLAHFVQEVFLKTGVFILVCISAWILGLYISNSEIKRHKAKIIKIEDRRENMELREKVEKAMEEVRKFLQSDGGDCEIVDVKDNIVSVRLQGACKGCPFSTLTLKNRIEAVIKEEVPEIKEVIAVD